MGTLAIVLVLLSVDITLSGISSTLDDIANELRKMRKKNE